HKSCSRFPQTPIQSPSVTLNIRFESSVPVLVSSSTGVITAAQLNGFRGCLLSINTASRG
ncbi:hypothetical protein COCCADRAFT_105058, partial [Bipolaris zeicola 26-R-13]